MDTVIEMDSKNGIKKQRIHDGHGYFNFLNKFNVLDRSTRFFFSSCEALET